MLARLFLLFTLTVTSLPEFDQTVVAAPACAVGPQLHVTLKQDLATVDEQPSETLSTISYAPFIVRIGVSNEDMVPTASNPFGIVKLPATIRKDQL